MSHPCVLWTAVDCGLWGFRWLLLLFFLRVRADRPEPLLGPIISVWTRREGGLGGPPPIYQIHHLQCMKTGPGGGLPPSVLRGPIGPSLLTRKHIFQTSIFYYSFSPHIPKPSFICEGQNLFFYNCFSMTY